MVARDETVIRNEALEEAARVVENSVDGVDRYDHGFHVWAMGIAADIRSLKTVRNANAKPSVPTCRLSKGCEAPEMCEELNRCTALKREPNAARQTERAQCTLCASEPSPGFYTGCMIQDGAAKQTGWNCDGKGNLTRFPAAPAGEAYARDLLRKLRRWLLEINHGYPEVKAYPMNKETELGLFLEEVAAYLERPAPAAPDVQQPLQPVDPNRVHAGWNIKGEPVYLDEPLAPDVASM